MGSIWVPKDIKNAPDVFYKSFLRTGHFSPGCETEECPFHYLYAPCCCAPQGPLDAECQGLIDSCLKFSVSETHFWCFFSSGVLTSTELWICLKMDHLGVSCYLPHWWIPKYNEVFSSEEAWIQGCRRPSVQGICNSFGHLSSLKICCVRRKGNQTKSSLTGPQARKQSGPIYTGSQGQESSAPLPMLCLMGWDALVAHLPLRLSPHAATALSAGDSHPGLWPVPTQTGDFLT